MTQQTDDRPAPPPGRYYSASQIKKSDRCLREWYLDRIWFEDRGEDSPAAAQGRVLHDEFLRWGQGQLHVDGMDRRLAMLCEDEDVLDLVGPDVPNVGREDEIRLNLAPWGIGSEDDPVWLWGFVDAHTWRMVFDLKTTKSLAQYAKRPAQLATDVQMMVYAYALHYRDPPEDVELVHGYVQREGSMDIDLVRRVVPWSDVVEAWQSFLAKVRALEATRLLVRHPRELIMTEFTPGHGDPCRAFGGCRHKDLCQSADGVDNLVKIGKPTEEPMEPNPETPIRIGRVLYIDCMPVKGPAPVMFEDICQVVADEFAAKAGKPWGLMKYREGSGPMGVAFERVALPEAVYLSSAHPLYAEARSALVPRCDLVVEGKR